jgi:hypothetical protein
VPLQQNLCFENVSVLYEKPTTFLAVSTPVDELKVSRCRLGANRAAFYSNSALRDYGRTQIKLFVALHIRPQGLGPDAFCLLTKKKSSVLASQSNWPLVVAHGSNEGLHGLRDMA